MGLIAALARLRTPAPVRQGRRALQVAEDRLREKIDQLAPVARAALKSTARRLAEVRAEIARLTGRADCCAVCAARLPGAAAQFPGGHCCGSDTPPVTLEPELAILVLEGRRPHRLPATRVLSGCLFRAPEGCTLGPRDRPCLCLAFMCSDLKMDLRRRGVLSEVLALCDELEAGTRLIASALRLAEPSSDPRRARTADAGSGPG
jgi:hypothetical protein